MAYATGGGDTIKGPPIPGKNQGDLTYSNARPVNALELYTFDPVTREKIYPVLNGKSSTLDVRTELCAGCGVCIGACPYKVISLSGRGETGFRTYRQYYDENGN